MQLRQRFITLKKKVLNYWQCFNTGQLWKRLTVMESTSFP
jgi:hypothetical protein